MTLHQNQTDNINRLHFSLACIDLHGQFESNLAKTITHDCGLPHFCLFIAILPAMNDLASLGLFIWQTVDIFISLAEYDSS